MLEDTGAETLDGLFHAGSELVAGTGALSGRFFVPLLEQAAVWGGAFEAGAVAAQPQQREVREGVAVKDLRKVELDVGLAGERCVVAQQAQHFAVGDDAPQVRVGAVEELLQQAVGGSLRGARQPGGESVDRGSPAHEMQRHPPAPFVADRVALRVVSGCEAPDGVGAGEAELLQQRQQPVSARQ